MWKDFRSPDISFPVVRRRIGLDLLEMLNILGDVAAHGGWAFLRNRSYENPAAYKSAVARLAKQGLIIEQRGADTPVLKISEGGSALLDPYFRPDRYWDRKWNGIWYLLVFDIPETDRSYRNVLRQFLKRQRMGCFQKSVWICPHDIRPQYADLETAAALNSFACLFEARTVLGMPAEKIVRESWDFDSLYAVQNRFCEIYSENAKILHQEVSPGLEALMQLAAEEIDAFRSAFILDPLLPDPLLPKDYRGKDAYELHLKITGQIRFKLSALNPD
jgi:DNA-binding transcriptional regulator PaaX